MPSLRLARCEYSRALAELVLWITSQGYEVAFDAVKATEGHIEKSTHLSGLGADLLLYKNGAYLTDSKDYQFAGEQWELMGAQRHLPLVWGGRFTKQDGNHFSHAWNGVQ
jgi:hypothetical protein